jgi:hypothetical protein
MSFPSLPEPTRQAAAPAGYSTLAFAGFAGVNAPLLVFVASSFMVCGGGQASCAF